MAEYMNYFGQGPEEKFILSIKKSIALLQTACLRMRRSIPKLIQQPQSIYLQPREKKKNASLSTIRC